MQNFVSFVILFSIYIYITIPLDRIFTPSCLEIFFRFFVAESHPHHVERNLSPPLKSASNSYFSLNTAAANIPPTGSLLLSFLGQISCFFIAADAAIAAIPPPEGGTLPSSTIYDDD